MNRGPSRVAISHCFLNVGDQGLLDLSRLPFYPSLPTMWLSASKLETGVQTVFTVPFLDGLPSRQGFHSVCMDLSSVVEMALLVPFKEQSLYPASLHTSSDRILLASS